MKLSLRKKAQVPNWHGIHMTFAAPDPDTDELPIEPADPQYAMDYIANFVTATGGKVHEQGHTRARLNDGTVEDEYYVIGMWKDNSPRVMFEVAERVAKALEEWGLAGSYPWFWRSMETYDQAGEIESGWWDPEQEPRPYDPLVEPDELEL